METPEFLVWALGYTCPIRGFQDGSDPERTERQLRAARAVGEARREGRVFEQWCIDPPYGFRIDEALAVYRGPAVVEQTCRACPVNALAQVHTPMLAGCYGIVPLTPDEQIHDAFDAAILGGELAQRYDHVFRAAKPRWYGLWMQSPLNHEQISLLAEILRRIGAPGPFRDLRAGLQTAMAAKVAVHATLYPRGWVDGATWKLVTHCPMCKAVWTDAAPGQCVACAYVGRPAPDKKRKARGQRPYFPLTRLLGEAGAANLLIKYERFRAQQASPDREQSPRHEAHPNSLPAD